MNFLTQLFAKRPDQREAMRQLWLRTVAIAREREWYADCGVADSLEGRFDMITAVLALVLLRMEGERELRGHTAFLTELFVEDMDGQLRQSGVGDLVVGKKIGRLMSTLGGRIGAYRSALAEEETEALAEATKRNVTLADAGKAPVLAGRLRALETRLARTAPEALLAGEIL